MYSKGGSSGVLLGGPVLVYCTRGKLKLGEEGRVSQLLDEKEHICRIRQGRAYMSDKTGQDIEIDPAIGVQIAAAVDPSLFSA